MKIVIFDMDGPLVTPDCRNAALAEVCSKLAKAANKNPEDVLKQILDVWKKETNNYDKYNWDLHIDKLRVNLGVKGKFDYAKAIKNNLKEASVYDEVYEVLKFIKSRGYLLYLATNGFEIYQMPILKSLKLVKYFDRMYMSSQKGILKPNVEFFDKDFNFKDVALLVDDLLYQGVYMGKKMKVKTCLIDRSFKDNDLKSYLKKKMDKEQIEQPFKLGVKDLKPDYVINDLRKIKEILV